jgi:hypothetical protein
MVKEKLVIETTFLIEARRSILRRGDERGCRAKAGIVKYADVVRGTVPIFIFAMHEMNLFLLKAIAWPPSP